MLGRMQPYTSTLHNHSAEHQVVVERRSLGKAAQGQAMPTIYSPMVPVVTAAQHLTKLSGKGTGQQLPLR